MLTKQFEVIGIAKGLAFMLTIKTLFGKFINNYEQICSD